MVFWQIFLSQICQRNNLNRKSTKQDRTHRIDKKMISSQSPYHSELKIREQTDKHKKYSLRYLYKIVIKSKLT